MTPKDHDIFFCSLCLWREARGESHDVKSGVAWVIRNRVMNPRWWGKNWIAVVTKPWQFSGMTGAGDANLIKFPNPSSTADWNSWLDCVGTMQGVYEGQISDPTQEATYYHDVSIEKPDSWGEVKKTVALGRLIFYKDN